MVREAGGNVTSIDGDERRTENGHMVCGTSSCMPNW